MTFTVKDFPIFHRYIVSFLLSVGLAEGSYSHILETVGEYTVEEYCHCGDEVCNSMYMRSETLIGRDGAFCFGYNIGFIIINFIKDGRFQVESLASRVEKNFPFRQEIRDVFDGKELGYNDDDAQSVVDDFMGGLERSKVKRIEV